MGKFIRNTGRERGFNSRLFQMKGLRNKKGYIRFSQRQTKLKPQSYYILLCANIRSNPRIHNSVVRCCG